MKQIVLFVLFLSILSTGSSAQIQNQKEQYPDDPSAREDYDFIRLRDPKTDEIPAFIGQKERDFASKLPKHDPFSGRFNAQTPSDWQQMGPMNQPGRAQAIGVDILDEHNLLAGSASGGVWKSIDSGQSWVKVTLPNDEQSVSAIVQDTRSGKESTWYYSTGELLSTTGRRETSNVRTHSWGNGIFKSTDNGASWFPLASTIATATHAAPINFTGIWNLALDPGNTTEDIIYAACYGGIMRSSDGGTTWANVLGGDSALCFNSEIIRGSGGTYYAAIGSAYDGTSPPHQGVWRSKDGINWANITSNILPKLIRRSRLAVSQSNENIVYFLTETPNQWNFPDTELNTQNTFSKYSYLSGDGSGAGGKWESRTSPFEYDPSSYYQSLGGYALVLAVHPDDPEKVLIGGTNLYYSSDGFDGPSDFYAIGGYPYNMEPGTLHPDMHACVFSRNNHSKIFMCTDGGVYEADDFINGYNNWKELDNGLSSAQVYHSSLDHDTKGSDFIMSGLQDNSTYATQSSVAADPWFVVSGGDGMTTAIASAGAQLFGSWQFGNIECFSNDGQYITYNGRMPPPSDESVSNFFTNYIVEPNHEKQLYEAETDHLWRFNDITAILAELGYIDPDWDEITAVYDVLHPLQGFITTFGFATNIDDRLFFGTNIGKVYQVDQASSASPVLKDISGSGFPQNGFVAGIEVDPVNADEIIVVFSNYNIQSLFRTTDGGKSWAAIGGNLEELADGAGSGPSIRCAKILHTAGGTIYYVGTSVGLYSTKTLNGTQTVWAQEAPSLIGDLIVESLDARQSDGRVIVSTQGGGVFKNVEVNAVHDEQSSGSQFLQLEQNYPNPFAAKSNIRFTISTPGNVTIGLYNALGEKKGNITNSIFEQGSHTIELSAKDLPAGNYFLRAIAGGAVSTRMITIVK